MEVGKQISLRRLAVRILALVFGFHWLRVGLVKGYDLAALLLVSLIFVDLCLGRLRRGPSSILLVAVSSLILGMLLSLNRVAIERPEFFLHDLLTAIRILIGISIMLSITLTLHTTRDVEAVLKWMVIGALCSFAWALPYFISGFLFGNFQNPAWLGMRFRGTSEVPNYYAVYSAAMVGLALGFFLHKNIKLNIWMRLASLIVIFLGALYIANSGSRTGFFALASTILLLIVFSKHIKKTRILGLGLIAGLLLVLMWSQLLSVPTIQFLAARIHNLTAQQARHVVWPYVITHIIANNPIVGVGFWSVPERVYEGTGVYNCSHNLILQVLVTTGLFGAIFLFLVATELVKKMFWFWKRSKKTFYLLTFVSLPLVIGAMTLNFLEVRWAWFIAGLWLTSIRDSDD